MSLINLTNLLTQPRVVRSALLAAAGLASVSFFLWMFTYSNPANEFIEVQGTVLAYKTEQIKLVKGGVSNFASVRYKYEYKDVVYESGRITCDAQGRLEAHSSNPDKVAAILKFAGQIENSKTVAVLIREIFLANHAYRWVSQLLLISIDKFV